jgi:hypothetical protein
MYADERFVEADSRNLPKVDVFMIGEYLNKNDCYNVAECESTEASISIFHCYNAVALAHIKVLFGLILIFTIEYCGKISKACCKCLRLKLRCIHGLFRSTRENYGDAAIGNVELKRDASKCVVKGRIRPE